MIANRLASAIAIVSALAFAPAVAHAQSEDQTLAQTLFEEALRLMSNGDFQAACPKLAESQRLDPGGGTVFNLALCREKEGKLASAWSAFNEAISVSIRDGRKDRENASREHLAVITPRLARLTIKVPQASMTSGLEIKVDGSPVRQAAWGIATPADIGVHAIVATAPGKIAWKNEVTIAADGQNESIDVPVLADAPVVLPPPDQKTQQHVATRNTTPAFIAGGIGVAGILTGTIAGVFVFAKRGESDADCKTGCTSKGVDAMNAAQSAAWVSNIGFGVGLAGLAAGVVLWVLAKPTTSSSAVTPHLGGATIAF